MKIVPIFLLIIIVLTTINILGFIFLFIYIKDKCQHISFPKRNHFKKKYNDKQKDIDNHQLKKFILNLTKEELDSNR